MMNGSGMFFGGGFMWIFWIILIVLFVFLIKWLVSGDASTPTPRGDSALEILRKRYARGEIDEQEFERRRRELED